MEKKGQMFTTSSIGNFMTQEQRKDCLIFITEALQELSLP